MSLLKAHLEKLEQKTDVQHDSLARIRARVHVTPPASQIWKYVRLSFLGTAAITVIALALNINPQSVTQPNIVLAAALEKTFGSSLADFYHNGAEDQITYRIWETSTPRPYGTARPLEIWSDGQDSKAHAEVYYFDGSAADWDYLAVGNETCEYVSPQNPDAIQNSQLSCQTTEDPLQTTLSNIIPHFSPPSDDNFAVRVDPVTVVDKNLEGFLVQWQTAAPMSPNSAGTVHYIEGALELGVDDLSDDLLSIEYLNRQSGSVYEHARFYSHSLSNTLYGFTFQIANNDAVSAIHHYDPVSNHLKEVSINELATLLLPAASDSNHMTSVGSLFTPIYYAALNNKLNNPLEVRTVDLDGRMVTYYRFPFTARLDEFTNMWKKRESLGGNYDQTLEFWVDENNQSIVQYRFMPAPEQVWQLKLVHEEIVNENPNTFFDLENWKATVQ